MDLEILKISIQNRHGEILEIQADSIDRFVDIIVGEKTFSLESMEELDFLYKKLREQIEHIEQKQNAETDERTKSKTT